MIRTKTIVVAVVILMTIATIGATVAAIGTGIAQAQVCLEATACAPPPPPTPSQNAQGNTQLEQFNQQQQRLQMTLDQQALSEQQVSNLEKAQQQSQNNVIQNIR